MSDNGGYGQREKKNETARAKQHDNKDKKEKRNERTNEQYSPSPHRAQLVTHGGGTSNAASEYRARQAGTALLWFARRCPVERERS